MKIFRPIWAEIDCDRVEFNLKLVRNIVGNKVKIMATVKANAYGHGATAVARSLMHAGADCLAVASLEEAVALRESGIKADILILGHTQPAWASYVVEQGFEQTIYHLGLARALSTEALKRKKKAVVHLKIDTGMSRIGVAPENALHLIKELLTLEGIELKGLFTHLSHADANEDDFTFGKLLKSDRLVKELIAKFKNIPHLHEANSTETHDDLINELYELNGFYPSQADVNYEEYTIGQLLKFNRLVEELKAEGINIPLLHAANSAGTLHYPQSHFDMVRPGIILYGLSPSKKLKEESSAFKPVMSIKSTIVELKKVPVGTRVSYSGTFVTEKPTRIATIPAGYADGFSRMLSNEGKVIINGYKAPIIGIVCMDFMMIDVTDVPGVRIDDEAVLVGKQGDEEITVDDIAAIMGTINYEVVSLIGKRVHRIFTNYHAGNPGEI